MMTYNECVMPDWLALLTDQRRLRHYFTDLLLVSLVLLADGWALVTVSRSYGLYLSLALEGSTAILALIIVGSTIRTTLRQIHESVTRGHFQPYLFSRLGVVVVAATLLVLPGFISDAVGLILYLPPARQIATVLVARHNRDLLRRVYEYVTLDVFASGE